MLDYYIGQVGINPNEFWANTWKENQLLGESYMIRMNVSWEQTRYLASMLVNVNVGKKSAMIAPDKLFPLPQDVYLERGKPQSTEAEFKAFVDKLNKLKSKG